MTLTKLNNGTYPSFPSLFERFLDGSISDWHKSDYAKTETSLPAVNITENNNEYQLELATPGMNKDDFKIDYDNGRLTISSERKEENETKEGEKITRREFSYSSFSRSFTVNKTLVDSENIVANYENGILKIVLPKREEVKPKPSKQIEIK